MRVDNNSRLVIANGQIFTPVQVLEGVSIVVEGSKIAALETQVTTHAYDPSLQVIDASNYLVVPGFIDVHVHGAMGYDTMDATPIALAEMAQFFAQHGVTSFLATTMAAETEALLAAIANVATYQRTPLRTDGAAILGLHLEGPYLSTGQPGAQPVKNIRPAVYEEYIQLFTHQNVRLLTLAPEVAANRELLKYAVEQGVAVAVGHSMATYAEVMEAVELGLNHACHTFNGMLGLHQREPGVVGAVLTCEQIFAQVIADLVHVHPAILNLLIKAKGAERTILITDAMRATGQPDGSYDLGGQAVTVCGGVACLAEGNSLAGSTLTLDQALRNIKEVTALPLPAILPMLTTTPAQSIGVGAARGKIEVGYLADLVILDSNLSVQLTMVEGRIVYQNPTFAFS
jgi:N-acetylglucosamine-6-phosphate deacetylase